MTNTNLNELPVEIQAKVKQTLRAYNKVNVIYENSKYNVSAGIAIKKEYAVDHKFIGTYNASEIFTADEKIINYIEEFISYPIEYKGTKNWAMIKELSNIRSQRKQVKIKLIEGNAVIDSIIDIVE